MGPIAEHRAVCFIRSPRKTGFTHASFFAGQTPGKRSTQHNCCGFCYNRPVKTDILGENYPFRRPQTATSRFIAHQACILYHKSLKIATLFYRCFCRNFNHKNRTKYTSCTKTNLKRLQKEARGHFPMKKFFFFPIFR